MYVLFIFSHPFRSIPFLVLSAPNLVPELLIHLAKVRVEVRSLGMFRWHRVHRAGLFTPTAFRLVITRRVRRRRLYSAVRAIFGRDPVHVCHDRRESREQSFASLKSLWWTPRVRFYIKNDGYDNIAVVVTQKLILFRRHANYYRYIRFYGEFSSGKQNRRRQY